jgi:DNA repair exonuclease SbcCD ATPase subunit
MRRGWEQQAPSLEFMVGQVLERTDAIREKVGDIQQEMTHVRHRLDLSTEMFHELRQRTDRIERAQESLRVKLDEKANKGNDQDWDKAIERGKMFLALALGGATVAHAGISEDALALFKAALGIGH